MISRLKTTLARGALGTVILLALGVVGARFTRHAKPRAVLDETMHNAPASASFFAFRGAGFSDNKRVIASDAASLAGQEPTRTISVSAPRVANGEFSVSSKPGVLATIHMVAAVKRAAAVERGAVTFESVYPGVDVIAVRDPERFELSYVLREARASLDVALAFGHIGTDAISENADGTLSVNGESGRARLQLSRATAVDANGAMRFGKYAIDGNVVKIALDTSGLTPPVVLDPVVYVPFWTLLEDGRQPGSASYLAARGSRETQVAFNPKSGRPWLIRPVRSQQHEDTTLNLGLLDDPFGDFSVITAQSPLVSAQSRVSNSTGPTFNAAQLVDWQRTFFAQSETWEWSGARWQLLPQSGLGGMIGPALGYAPGAGKMVAFGGAVPEVSCGVSGSQSFTRCSMLTTAIADAAKVFENDGSGWTKRALPGAPHPRLRPSVGTFGSNALVFGGRALLLDPQIISYSGQLFPDTFSGSLLNDTWLYDGSRWVSVPASNPPPVQEGAQVVYDARRKRSVLVGGNSLERPENADPPWLGLDPFSLWEFDGTDWIERFEPGDTRLPVSFQQRRGVAAVWHPVRQTTILFGGFVDVLDTCPFSGNVLAQKRLAATTDTTLAQQLMTQGCAAGYAHDAWEWDGANLKQLTQVAFGGTEAVRIPIQSSTNGVVAQPVYRQVSGTLPAPGSLANNDLTGSTDSHLWPFRYDASMNHFPLRSALERAYAPPAASAPARKDPGAAQPGATPPAAPAFASPVFAAMAMPQLSFDPSSGRIVIFSAGDGRVFDTDLQSWVDRTPATSPFDTGENDFFAATWDSGRQRVVLFDPRTGLTWEHSDNGGWTKPAVAGSPGVWSVNTTIRSFRDLNELDVLQLPKMTYDRARAKTVMIYGNSVWEYDGASWAPRTLVASLTNCKTATMAAFDGHRNRTVVVGCGLPAQTWEWDGETWFGPFGTPFVGVVHRDGQAGSAFAWMGPLQLTWAHPNALFESASLGGVGTIDADGTLRLWNGTAWSTGPVLPENHLSDAASAAITGGSVGGAVPFSPFFINDFNFAANVFSPPVIEDFAGHRILAFRDGVTGLRQLPVPTDPTQIVWQSPIIGNPDSFAARMVYPHPYELLTPEHLIMSAHCDPSAKTDWAGNPKADHFLSDDDSVNNLYWPFRLLSDPTTQRVRILTHRGALWELGSESAQAPGGACASVNDCGSSPFCAQGTCCETACSGPCATCNGTHPGSCETLGAGSACNGASCSNGMLTSGGQCNGVSTSCQGSNVTQPCPGGLACADANSCKTQCASAADCVDPTTTCSADGLGCVVNPTATFSCQNGVLSRLDGTSSAPCPGALGCADAHSCKTTCATRTDCVSPFETCSSVAPACAPDGAATLATARGITPVNWTTPRVRTPEEIGTLLQSQGFPSDDAGIIGIPGAAAGGVQLAFDPNLKNPLMGVCTCMYRIQACMMATSKVDECVAAMPRCVGSTPWLGDAAGLDCCPESCLEKYFQRRATSNQRVGLDDFLFSGCYPGLADFLKDETGQ